MSVLTVENLGYTIGSFDVFTGISGTIARDSKIGLIGPNGVGKTTLLLNLAGVYTPTAGTIHVARGRKLGYLRQEAIDAFANRENTVYAEMLSVFADLQERQARLNELEAEMATGQASAQRLQEYGDRLESFEHAGGYDYELRIQRTLDGLGLGKKSWHKPLCHLSGGQKTHALLARLLLEKPDLLMLDEPTNHLDIEAVEWLERTLREWDGAVLIVSHDRYFLDNVVNTIWEMSRSGIEVYSGNYSAYLVQREERWEYYERVYQEEKARLLKEADFIQRNWVRASTHARALGMLKKLSRELAIVEHFGIQALRNGTKWHETGLSADKPLDVVEAIRKVNGIPLAARPPRLRPRLAASPISGNLVLKVEQAVIGYPGHPLFTVEGLELRRGETAALIGPNGSGKTTFLRTILGQIKALEGEVQLGASLKIGYLAQAHDALNSPRSVLDEIISHKEMHPGEARSYLAQFLFRGDDVFKPVNALSGGERARLALAILALEGTNTLILDEPTNHLDLPAQEALQEVLESYQGTILLVSHDRYLINRLATQIWNLHENRLHIFKGSYREYLLRQEVGSSPERARQIILPPRPAARDNSKETRKREQALQLLEERIRDQENAVRRLTRELQKNGQGLPFERVQALSWQVAQAQARLDSLMEEWEKLVEERIAD